MQRRFDRRLWTLILSLLLACGSLSVPTYVRADLSGDVSQPPPPDGGDPDWPDHRGGGSQQPKPGPGKGAADHTMDAYSARMRWVQWMKWTIRVAYGSTWRVFFRV